ncbi:MAG: hypothetical protein Q6373_023985 [Candidatus Sigynarchaeota archaeon]
MYVWKFGRLAGPINGRYFFEVYLQEKEGGVMVPVEESRRVGSFDASWGHFSHDPLNAGVTMYVDRDRMPTVTWTDLLLNEFEIPSDVFENKQYLDDVFSFWEALPDNY